MEPAVTCAALYPWEIAGDVNAGDGSHATRIHLASHSPWSNGDVVQILIQNEADVNARDVNHSTPLHGMGTSRCLCIWCWSRRGVVMPLRTLIKNGADVNARNGNHSTPLHLASSGWMYAEAAQLLVKHAADVNARDKSHSTPLYLAVLSSSSNGFMLSWILSGGDDNVRDANGNHTAPSHLASKSEPSNGGIVQLTATRAAHGVVCDDYLRKANKQCTHRMDNAIVVQNAMNLLSVTNKKGHLRRHVVVLLWYLGFVLAPDNIRY
ncbi:ankyrin repeat-containing domain protein [Lactarius hatsudake]|nr:ankyrin repeat-containing domain protein [Lactarius hatsudake]